MMQILYGALALGAVVILAKDLLVHGGFDLISTQETLEFVGLMGGSLPLTHLILALYERHVDEAVRRDLADGIKIRRYATLIDLQEFAESEPSRFCVLDDISGLKEGIRAEIDIRIKPHKTCSPRRKASRDRIRTKFGNRAATARVKHFIGSVELGPSGA